MPYIYTASAKQQVIEPILVRLAQNERLGFDLTGPIENINSSRVRWQQDDIYRGLAQMRGMNGEPLSIKLPGTNWYEYEPAVYGEYGQIEEREMTERTINLDPLSDNINVTDLVDKIDETLIGRELDLIEYCIWQAAGTGTIKIYMPGPNGPILGFSYTFTLQTATSAISWSTTATATPIRDLQAIALLGQPAGKSVNFGAGAKMYMNSYTAQQLLNNTNASDLGGRKTQGGGTVNTLQGIREILVGADLPSMVVYDNGWVDENGTYQLFIPNGRVIIVGKRPGGRKVLGYVRTRNANFPLNGKPGSYRYVKDNTKSTNAEVQTPPVIEVHRGHNGGVVVYYPSAIYVQNV